VEGLSTKVQQLTDINCAYYSDIKVQRRIASKLKTELQIAEEKKKHLHNDSKDHLKKHEKVSSTLMFIPLSQHKHITQIACTRP
jgi:hypothetical protein